MPAVTAVFPGSFNPFTLGHDDIVRRATALFDRVVIAVGTNSSKAGVPPVEERVAAVQEATADLAAVEVRPLTGLLVDLCAEVGAKAIVKGVRNGADVDYEFGMAQMNAHIADVETVLLPTAPQWAFVSSTLVREVHRFGGDVSDLVPAAILKRLTTPSEGTHEH